MFDKNILLFIDDDINYYVNRYYQARSKHNKGAHD